MSEDLRPTLTAVLSGTGVIFTAATAIHATLTDARIRTQRARAIGRWQDAFAVQDDTIAKLTRTAQAAIAERDAWRERAENEARAATTARAQLGKALTRLGIRG